MAEVAIAGTFPAPMRGMRCDAVDRVVLETERYAEPVDPEDERHAAGCRCSASPIPGLEIRIVDPDTGEVLREREVGELEIRGTSVTPGYYKRPDATAELLPRRLAAHRRPRATCSTASWCCAAASRTSSSSAAATSSPRTSSGPSARSTACAAGNVIAFGVDGYKGKEAVVVVAETRADDVEAVRKAVHQRVLEVAGVPPRDVMLVRRRHAAEDGSPASCSGACASSAIWTKTCSSPDSRCCSTRAHEVEQQPVDEQYGERDQRQDRDHEDRPAALLAHHHEGDASGTPPRSRLTPPEPGRALARVGDRSGRRPRGTR